MELASPSSSSSSAAALAPAPASASASTSRAQSKKDGGKNLLGIFMDLGGRRVDVGLGLRLFD
jgi:hypothetical protein